MAIRLNQQAVEHAQNFIKGRQYEWNSDWSEAQPSAEEENNFIDENGWEAFAKWHLADDTEASEVTKSRYKSYTGTPCIGTTSHINTEIVVATEELPERFSLLLGARSSQARFRPCSRL